MTAETVAMEKENLPVVESHNNYNNNNTKDDEMMMAEPPAAAVPVTPAPAPKDHVFSPELLKMYYSRLFPFEFMHQWLAYDPLGKNPQVFSRREFSFTIEPFPGEEIYIRYQSFSSEQELRDAIMKRQPHKIDIGAVFNHPPKDKNAAHNFAPVQRELVFDIDLTDYDEIRNCGCSGAKICQKCWTFMTMAVKIMDEGLKEDFGFERIAWFYSGRRGVHAWVADESARTLSNEARSAVANYFEVSLQSTQQYCTNTAPAALQVGFVGRGDEQSMTHHTLSLCTAKPHHADCADYTDYTSRSHSERRKVKVCLSLCIPCSNVPLKF